MSSKIWVHHLKTYKVKKLPWHFQNESWESDGWPFLFLYHTFQLLFWTCTFISQILFFTQLIKNWLISHHFTKNSSLDFTLFSHIHKLSFAKFDTTEHIHHWLTKKQLTLCLLYFYWITHSPSLLLVPPSVSQFRCFLDFWYRFYVFLPLHLCISISYWILDILFLLYF